MYVVCLHSTSASCTKTPTDGNIYMYHETSFHCFWMDRGYDSCGKVLYVLET